MLSTFWNCCAERFGKEYPYGTFEKGAQAVLLTSERATDCEASPILVSPLLVPEVSFGEEMVCHDLRPSRMGFTWGFRKLRFWKACLQVSVEEEVLEGISEEHHVLQFKGSCFTDRS